MHPRNTPLDADVLDTLFLEARTYNSSVQGAVTNDTVVKNDLEPVTGLR